MSTPDPQTVREIAQQAMAEMAFRYDAVGSVVAARGLDYDEYVATVMAHIDAATIQVSWPDERPQDVRDAALAEVTAELEAANANADEIAEQRAEYREEIMRLRARVRELEAAQDERDGDVRAVRALTNAASRMLGTWAEADEAVRRELWTTLHDRADDVFDRCRERYAEMDAKAAAALEARDAKGGER